LREFKSEDKFSVSLIEGSGLNFVISIENDSDIPNANEHVKIDGSIYEVVKTERAYKPISPPIKSDIVFIAVKELDQSRQE